MEKCASVKLIILVRANFQKRACSRDFWRVVSYSRRICGVIFSSGGDAQIAIDGRKMPWLIREGERRNRIERLKNIARSRNQRAIKSRVEVIFLRQLPAHKLVGLAVAGAVKQTLRDRVHEFIGVGQRLVFVKANKVVELIHASHIVVRDFRIDGVLPFPFPLSQMRSSEGGRRSILNSPVVRRKGSLTTAPQSPVRRSSWSAEYSLW